MCGMSTKCFLVIVLVFSNSTCRDTKGLVTSSMQREFQVTRQVELSILEIMILTDPLNRFCPIKAQRGESGSRILKLYRQIELWSASRTNFPICCYSKPKLNFWYMAFLWFSFHVTAKSLSLDSKLELKVLENVRFQKRKSLVHLKV